MEDVTWHSDSGKIHRTLRTREGCIGAKTPQGPIYLGYPERGGRGGGRDDVPRNAPLPDARRGPHVSFAAMLSAHALYLSLDSFNILGT